jgi:hypothetical protein
MLRQHLSEWLTRNRSERCKLVQEEEGGGADSTVGVPAVGVILRMRPGKQHELEYLRAAKQVPSAVTRFRIEAVDADGIGAPWSGEVRSYRLPLVCRCHLIIRPPHSPHSPRPHVDLADGRSP